MNMNNKPIITKSIPEYLSAISIKGNSEPNFSNIPPIGNLINLHELRDIHIEPYLNSLLEKDILEYVKQDNYPIPATEEREFYHGANHIAWWLSGLRSYLETKKMVEGKDSKLPEDTKVLEIGCATGRVIRPFTLHQSKYETWGCDINLRHIEWMRKYLPKSIRIFQNHILPILPLEDNYFDLVCAYSVFTHIDDFDIAWILEIRRILKKGGIAVISIHTENTWKGYSIRPDLPVFQATNEMGSHIKDFELSEDFWKNGMPMEKTVFRWETVKNYNCNVFLHTDFIKRNWGRHFSDLKIISIDFNNIIDNYQDWVILKK